MCNKYKEHSKTQDYEKKDIVEKCNSIDTDYTYKVKNKQCLVCRNGCPDMSFKITGSCGHFKSRMTLKELNREIKTQGVNVSRLCDKHGLSRNIMYEALGNKRALPYDYYYALEVRLNEKSEYLNYLDREVSNG